MASEDSRCHRAGSSPGAADRSCLGTQHLASDLPPSPPVNCYFQVFQGFIWNKVLWESQMMFLFVWYFIECQHEPMEKKNPILFIMEAQLVRDD